MISWRDHICNKHQSRAIGLVTSNLFILVIFFVFSPFFDKLFATMAIFADACLLFPILPLGFHRT